MLFILDASGSMGAVATDGRTRFDHAKEQVTRSAADFATQGIGMGLMIFSHRTGRCDDIEVTVPMSDSANSARMSIESVLAPMRQRGGTPLTRSINVATQYLLDHHYEGTEVIVVSDGLDNCGGNPLQAAQDLRLRAHASLSVIGMDIDEREVPIFQEVTRLGGGSFRRELTGASDGGPPGTAGPSPRLQPGASRALPAPSLPPSGSPPPGTYSRGRFPPKAPEQLPPGKHGREGAPDDSRPIVDPNSVPREMSFDQPPPPSDPPPLRIQLAAPPAAPREPAQESAPKPRPSEAPPEMPMTKPMLL